MGSLKKYHVMETMEPKNVDDISASKSILQQHVRGYWCFNCHHFIESDDVFTNQKHHEYMYQKFEEISSPRIDYLPCICLDCVYYRVQQCMACKKGNPLCMYPLCQWFEHYSKERVCIDCSAVSEAKNILKSLSNLCASQCVLQCNKCCQYKYITSFTSFCATTSENNRRVIRDLDFKKDQKLYKRTVCLECRLYDDVSNYRNVLKERYHSKISNEPELKAVGIKITAENLKADDYFGEVLSYANAVSGKKDVLHEHKVNIQEIVELLQKDDPDCTSGPVYFLSTMRDYVSAILLRVLQDEIVSLQAKTQLELKLSGLPQSIWDEVLQKKMQFTTHMFSLQSSGLSNFQSPESRWAYVAVYTPVHASMVYDIVLQGCFMPLLNVISKATNSDSFQVSCFGAGPGSEVIGLNPFLPDSTKYQLFDNCAFWEHNAKSLLKTGMGLDFQFHYFDAQKFIRKDHLNIIKKSKLMTFVKFISAIQNQYNAGICMKSIFDAAPSGSCMLIIDNSQPQIKQFVENLIFPNQDFVEKTNCKENSKYEMYTSYAEYRFDVCDMMRDHDEICRLLSLVMEWVERPPLVDVRVYVFLVVKK